MNGAGAEESQQSAVGPIRSTALLLGDHRRVLADKRTELFSIARVKGKVVGWVQRMIGNPVPILHTPLCAAVGELRGSNDEVLRLAFPFC